MIPTIGTVTAVTHRQTHDITQDIRLHQDVSWVVGLASLESRTCTCHPGINFYRIGIRWRWVPRFSRRRICVFGGSRLGSEVQQKQLGLNSFFCLHDFFESWWFQADPFEEFPSCKLTWHIDKQSPILCRKYSFNPGPFSQPSQLC